MREYHHWINLLLNRLDEQQRRWYARLESMRIGYGGDRFGAQLTGLSEKTVCRGRLRSMPACPWSARVLQKLGLPQKKTLHTTERTWRANIFLNALCSGKSVCGLIARAEIQDMPRRSSKW